MGTFPSLDVFPTLISDEGNASDMSASDVVVDNCGKGRRMTYLTFLVTPLETATCLWDSHKIGNPSPILSASLI